MSEKSNILTHFKLFETCVKPILVYCLPIFLVCFPYFHVFSDEKKFLYLFQCEEYDIVEIIVREVNEMHNRRNELINKFKKINISVEDIFVYCIQNDGNNVTVSGKHRSLYFD